MDQHASELIRLSATRRFRSMVVSLLLISLLAIAARFAQRIIADNYGRATLARESAALTREFMRFEAERGAQLIPYPPPDDPARRGAWVRHIEEQLLQPAAVCVIQGSALTWVKLPPAFQVPADSTALLLTAPNGIRSTASLKIHGDTELLRTSVQADARDNFGLWLVGKTGDSLRWGVLLSSNDTWVAFFHQLQGTAADNPDIGSPAWALQDMFALPKSTTRQWNMGLRAFLKDALIFSSGDLDTTRLSYTYDFNGRRAECYLSRWQETTTHWKIMRLAFWPMLLLPLVLLVPFYRDYRQIRRLTDREKTGTLHD